MLSTRVEGSAALEALCPVNHSQARKEECNSIRSMHEGVAALEALCPVIIHNLTETNDEHFHGVAASLRTKGYLLC